MSAGGAEELGLDLAVGRLLCLEWQGPEPGRTESLIDLGQDELLSYAFVEPTELDGHLVPRLARRMRAALLALDEDRVVEMEHGDVVATPPAAVRPG